MMMPMMVPPGFRFHPTEEELVGYYLRKKVASQKIDFDVIKDIDLYSIEPWDLQEKCRIGYGEQKEWYFFNHKYKKYPTGTRTNRATMAGFWKATGRDKAVYDKSEAIIGMRKTLVFYLGRAPNGQKTDWVMREYRLQSHNPSRSQEEGWVLCRAFKKRTAATATATGGGGRGKSNNNEDDERHRFLCNRNPAADMNIHRLRPVQSRRDNNQFAPLPRLQSPASSPSMLSESYKLHDSSSKEEEGDREMSISNHKVSDWRALDKFVASQLLSHDDLSFEYRS